jgi:thioredoxin 2
MTFSRKVTCPFCGASDRIPAEQFSDDLVCAHCGRAMFAGKPIEVDAARFGELVADEKPLLVDFWAAWCGPCKAMAPAFEQASQTLADTVQFAKLNTDDEQQLAQEHGIRSIPTMILFREGKEIARHSGAMSAGDIQSWVESQLGDVAA